MRKGLRFRHGQSQTPEFSFWCYWMPFLGLDAIGQYPPAKDTKSCEGGQGSWHSNVVWGENENAGNKEM